MRQLTVHLSAAGMAEPEVVWERYADTTRWSTWSPQIGRVEPSGARLHRDLAGRVHARIVPVSVDFRVIDVDDTDPTLRRWSWEARLGRLRLTLGHDVRPRPGGGTIAGLAISGPLPAVLAYAPAARLALTLLVRPGGRFSQSERQRA